MTKDVHVSIRLFINLSYVHPSIFWFLDDNLSKCQWIFTKLGLCIYIVDIWFGTANGPNFISF